MMKHLQVLEVANAAAVAAETSTSSTRKVCLTCPEATLRSSWPAASRMQRIVAAAAALMYAACLHAPQPMCRQPSMP
jgi:hypothetical protein